MHSYQAANDTTTSPDTDALCRHLHEARAMLGVLGSAAADACAQGVDLDADQIGDYAAVLGRLVRDALTIAEAVEDRCIVVPCTSVDAYQRADALRRELVEAQHAH
jgi:hypothetical protein